MPANSELRAAPKLNWWQKAIKPPQQHMRALRSTWRDRKDLTASHLDPEENRLRNLANAVDPGASRGGLTPFAYNMIVNPGHTPGSTFVSLPGLQKNPGQGPRDRALGSLASIPLIYAAGKGGARALGALGARAGGKAIASRGGFNLLKSPTTALKTLKKVLNLAPLGIAGAGMASDVYRNVNEISRATGVPAQKLYGSATRDASNIKPWPAAKLIGGLALPDTPTVNAMKQVGLGHLIQPRRKENFVQGLSDFIINTNPLVAGFTAIRSRAGDWLKNRGVNRILTTKPKTIHSDIKNSRAARLASKVVNDPGYLFSNMETPETIQALQGTDPETLEAYTKQRAVEQTPTQREAIGAVLAATGAGNVGDEDLMAAEVSEALNNRALQQLAQSRDSGHASQIVQEALPYTTAVTGRKMIQAPRDFINQSPSQLALRGAAGYAGLSGSDRAAGWLNTAAAIPGLRAETSEAADRYRQLDYIARTSQDPRVRAQANLGKYMAFKRIPGVATRAVRPAIRAERIHRQQQARQDF